MRCTAIVAVLVGSSALARAEVPAELKASVDTLFPPTGPVFRTTLLDEVTDKAKWRLDPRFQASDLGGGHQSISFPWRPEVTREQLAAHFTAIWGAPVVIGKGREASPTWVSPAGRVRLQIKGNYVPTTVELTAIAPVETLFAAGPMLVADKLVQPGTPHDKIYNSPKITVRFEGKPAWFGAPRIQRTDWMTWPGDTHVDVHVSKAGLVDGYRISIPYDAHPPFATAVKDAMIKAWGKPQKRGKQLVFTGKRGTATATDTGTSWDLELMVR